MIESSGRLKIFGLSFNRTSRLNRLRIKRWKDWTFGREQITNFLNLFDMKTVFLLNAFSLQMLEGDATVKFSEVSSEQVFSTGHLVSAIGHQDTARVLGVEMNRINVTLQKGDIAYVAQLQGGRLPEGSTTLPEGFKFKFIKVEVL